MQEEDPMDSISDADLTHDEIKKYIENLKKNPNEIDIKLDSLKNLLGKGWGDILEKEIVRTINISSSFDAIEILFDIIKDERIEDTARIKAIQFVYEKDFYRASKILGEIMNLDNQSLKMKSEVRQYLSKIGKRLGHDNPEEYIKIVFDSILVKREEPKKLTTTEDVFVEPKLFNEPFYSDLVDELNKAYNYKIYTAVFLLSRKLIENTIIEILRKKFPNEKNLWERIRNQETLLVNLYNLIENLCKKTSIFTQANISSTKSNIDQIRGNFHLIRNKTNLVVHSISIIPNDSHIKDLKDLINAVIPILYKLKN